MLSHILIQAANLLPKEPALKRGTEVIRYRELLEKTSRLAYQFQALGLKPGDRLALLGQPCPEFAVAEFAAITLGAIPFAVYSELSTGEMERIVADAEPAFAVVDADTEARFGWAAPGAESGTDIRVRRMEDAFSASLTELLDAGEKLPPEQWRQSESSDPAVLIYTGGTSGRSKGVIHTHGSMMSWFNVNPPAGFGHSPSQRSICFNLAHLTGHSVLWMTAAAGGCVHFLDRYPAQADEVILLARRENITHIGTVGTLLRDILQKLEQDDSTLPSVRVVTCGGTAIHPDTLERSMRLFPSAVTLNVYSQTESGTMISMLPANAVLAKEGSLKRLRSVGQPESMRQFGQQPFSVRILNEHGVDLPVGQAGEIAVNGAQVMAGYWRNEAETQRVLKDGWLHTGDIGYLDEQGYLFLADRKKDMIIVNGVNVYASEVEQVLDRHPSVAEAAVVGVAGRFEGESIAAFVVPVPGQTPDLDDIRTFLAPHLAAFKLPVILRLAEAMPLTVVGKPDKKAIRQLFISAESL